MPLYRIFPRPIYLSKLERALTKKELKIINNYKDKTYKNLSNTTSSENYILENKTLNNLKKDLNKKIIDYFNKIVCPKNSITPYITQSWINYTKENQFHHQHWHPNSYVSGVFYINADKEVDQVRFFKGKFEEIALECKEFNEFNAPSWSCSIETGDVILFPATLIHGVDRKKGTDTRISLSFNVFFKGTIGNKEDLAELILV